ncbi:hypothetical protein FGE20_10750 [Elizabethkingia sp. JS20170427COW]|nr:hypothetical protein FGE20_10750 [Elizabethkingia sp. JS20170427COW]
MSCWEAFLEDLHEEDSIKYSAVKACKLAKKEESKIEVRVPSEIAKSEFESLKKDFLSMFQVKVNNFHVKIKYVKDESLHKEIITKRKLFDNFAKVNPVLAELDKIMRFDFS